MIWTLIMFSKGDNLYIDEKNIEMIFTRQDSNIYKVFCLRDYNSICEFENDILETLNYYVCIRDDVYMICDIKSGCYNFVCKNMTFLRKRLKNVFDTSDKIKIEFFS